VALGCWPAAQGAEADAGTIAWLLEGEPAVRYLTLTRLLGEPADGAGGATANGSADGGRSAGSAAAAEARRRIMTEGAVPAILAAQRDDGGWAEPGRFYSAKYAGTVWQLLILAELGADGADERVRRGCEAVLRDGQDAASGGFGHKHAAHGGCTRATVIPCLTGNMVYSLIRLGMLDDPRVQRAIDWITTYQRFDDGDERLDGDDAPPTGWPYHVEMCWGRHTCHMGAAKALKALAEVLPERRTPAVRHTLAAGAEYFLRHHVHRRSHDLTRDAKPGWRRFGFPLMYQTDALELLGILTRLGREGAVAGAAADGTGGAPILGDARMDEALALVASKADAQGRWKLQNTFNGRFVVDIETKGEPSRWVTAKALEVLGATSP